jgi:hypothetical protein
MAPSSTRVSLRGGSFGRGFALAVAVGLVLSGCSEGSGFDLNGRVFDWMGISPAAVAARRDEPKLADRAPLVLPPDSTRLPVPGSGQTTQTAASAAAPTAGWPDDPDQRKVLEAKERERLHQAYCRGDMQWKDRALNPGDINVPKSPYGPCTLFGDALTNNVNKQ